MLKYLFMAECSIPIWISTTINLLKGLGQKKIMMISFPTWWLSSQPPFFLVPVFFLHLFLPEKNVLRLLERKKLASLPYSSVITLSSLGCIFPNDVQYNAHSLVKKKEMMPVAGTIRASCDQENPFIHVWRKAQPWWLIDYASNILIKTVL